MTSAKDLQAIYEEMAGEVSEETFYRIYDQATSERFGFLFLDMHPKDSLTQVPTGVDLTPSWCRESENFLQPSCQERYEGISAKILRHKPIVHHSYEDVTDGCSTREDPETVHDRQAWTGQEGGGMRTLRIRRALPGHEGGQTDCNTATRIVLLSCGVLWKRFWVRTKYGCGGVGTPTHKKDTHIHIHIHQKPGGSDPPGKTGSRRVEQRAACAAPPVSRLSVGAVVVRSYTHTCITSTHTRPCVRRLVDAQWRGRGGRGRGGRGSHHGNSCGALATSGADGGAGRRRRC